MNTKKFLFFCPLSHHCESLNYTHTVKRLSVLSPSVGFSLTIC